MASRISLASVLPDLTRSPIRNCHFQTPGISDLVSVYSTPLWFMEISGIPPTATRVGTERFHLFDSALCDSARNAAHARTRCAAQTEYGRLAAQAYSPSDAI